MHSEHHFHLEIQAPKGLAGIEPHLPKSLLPLKTYFSHFTNQVILVMSDVGDEFEFEMAGSLDEIMHGSGHIVGVFEDAIIKINSLSMVLVAAGFPHRIGVDDDPTSRSAVIHYRWH